jgi:hypothetical protein
VSWPQFLARAGSPPLSLPELRHVRPDWLDINAARIVNIQPLT